MTISTHVLDLSRGAPAAGVEVTLCRCEGTARREIAHALTDGDGRIAKPFGGELSPGEYELEFHAGAYFSALGTESLFERVPVRFLANEERHYHMPLLLSPWGYSTYRGS